MENKVKNVLSGIGFYGTLAVCLLVVGVCGWVLLQDREDPLPQQAVTPQHLHFHVLGGEKLPV